MISMNTTTNTTRNMTTIICTFCKEEGHACHDKEGAVICTTLLENECTYCKQRGHTNKRCPTAKQNHLNRMAKKAENAQKSKDYEERVKARELKSDAHNKHIDAEVKAGSWAGHLMASVSSEERREIEDKNRAFAHNLYLQEQNAKKRKQHEWEIRYPGKMAVKFGKFWFFRVIGTTFDCPKVADEFRTPEAHVAYRLYLEHKYGEDWEFDSLAGEDKCDYLTKMIMDLRTMNQVATLESSRDAVAEIEELSKTLTNDELQAHIDISTNEFMEELEQSNISSDSGEWEKQDKRGKKEKKKSKAKAMVSNI